MTNRLIKFVDMNFAPLRTEAGEELWFSGEGLIEDYVISLGDMVRESPGDSYGRIVSIMLVNPIETWTRTATEEPGQ